MCGRVDCFIPPRCNASYWILDLHFWMASLQWNNAIVHFLGSGFQLAGTLLNNAAMLNFAYWCMGTQGYVVLTILVIVVPFFILMGGMKLFGRFIHLSLAILIVVAVVLVGNALASTPDAFRQAYSSLADRKHIKASLQQRRRPGGLETPHLKVLFQCTILPFLP